MPVTRIPVTSRSVAARSPRHRRISSLAAQAMTTAATSNATRMLKMTRREWRSRTLPNTQFARDTAGQRTVMPPIGCLEATACRRRSSPQALGRARRDSRKPLRSTKCPTRARAVSKPVLRLAGYTAVTGSGGATEEPFSRSNPVSETSAPSYRDGPRGGEWCPPSLLLGRPKASRATRAGHQ